MPAKSEKQRRLMGAALSYKRGENENASDEVKKVAQSMTEAELAVSNTTLKIFCIKILSVLLTI